MKKLFGRRLTGKFIAVIVSFIFIFSMGFLTGRNRTTVKPTGNKITDTKSTDKTTTKDNSVANKTEDNSSKYSTKQLKENKVSPSTTPLDPNKKVAYLTFDDGPTRKITPKVLETLDKYNVKATFFVLGQMAKANPDLLKAERVKGHAICNHSYSHNYKLLYSSSTNFLQDFEKSAQTIKSILGDYNGKVIRFPGGSYGSKRAPYKQVAKNAGYTYVDWNALNGDAEHQHVPADQLVARVQSSTKGKNHVVILMHDAATKSTTLEALPRVIEYLKNQGYSFSTLDESGNIPANLPSVHGPNEKTTEVSKPTKTK